MSFVDLIKRAPDRPPVAPEEDGPAVGPGQRLHAALRWTTTTLAVLLVWFALVAPLRLSDLTIGAFLRVPVEGVVVVAIALVLPPRPRRILAVVVGVLLGILALVKILDMGVFELFDRPFNPVVDWGNIPPAFGVLRDSVGRVWADAAVVGTALFVVALLVFMTLSVLRLLKLTTGHRTVSARVTAAFGIVWVVCAVLGVQVGGIAPLASSNAATLAYDQVQAIRAAAHDQHTFLSGIAAKDHFASAPGADLLTALRGKDVLIVFVESYGRVAVQGSAFSPPIDAVLKSGTKQLTAAGFAAKSAFLTSPTFGGISWLAHSTLQSGLWINNQQRYDQLVSSDRFTLSDAFKRAGWRTVSDVPADNRVWAQGTSFYHYAKLYNSLNVGYVGPRFSYAPVPDQYTLSAFQQLELAKPHRAPVMAEIDLVSSHTPWTPLPHMVPPQSLGNGEVFDGMPQQGQSPSVVWRDANNVRTLYGESIQYSLRAVISFVQQAHDDNLVVVMLGDHQPATIVSGARASHDVPITIIAHDPNVMKRITSWRWQNGMLPSASAPVWPMDTFRDRFLTAYR